MREVDVQRKKRQIQGCRGYRVVNAEVQQKLAECEFDLWSPSCC